jgi:hypothetical protein
MEEVQSADWETTGNHGSGVVMHEEFMSSGQDSYTIGALLSADRSVADFEKRSLHFLHQ